jgi:hypothetical protein
MIDLDIVLVALTAGLLAGAAVALVSAAGSRWALNRIARVRPYIRVLIVLGYLAAPALVATIVGLGVAFYPHVSPVDLVTHHCHVTANGCAAHDAAMTPLPVAALVAFITTLIVVRIAHVAGRQLNGAIGFSRILNRAAAKDGEGQYRVATDRPVAFAAGLFRPSVYLSRGLVDRLDSREIDIVVAHEQAHARRCDPALRFLASLFASLHLPATARRLMSDLTLAQEQACDAITARRYPAADIASLLVRMERFKINGEASTATAFTGAVVEHRVKALLDPRFETTAISLTRLGLFCIASAALMLVALEPLHHEIETVFAALGDR